jgi:hypothetical protein
VAAWEMVTRKSNPTSTRAGKAILILAVGLFESVRRNNRTTPECPGQDYEESSR